MAPMYQIRYLREIIKREAGRMESTLKPTLMIWEKHRKANQGEALHFLTVLISKLVTKKTKVPIYNLSKRR